MASKSDKIVKLSCIPQKYAWGKPAATSKVAQLLSIPKEDKENYAELWMGTHPKGPSSVIFDDNNKQTQLLSDYIGHELPYLFKVLSVARSLSIQAHPNKELAKKLHAERPQIYKSDQHKPEMTIALTPFEAMCGFRPYSQILFFLNNVPEFAQIVGDKVAKSFKESKDHANALKDLFSSVMTAPKENVSKLVKNLVNRLEKERIPSFADKDKDEKEKEKEQNVRNIEINELIVRLNKEYEGDVGIFAVFMLNCFRLRVGEAMYLEANLVHAYLSGDCLECMACSDNVVRAGLTPKLRDTPVLCQMLNYEKMSKPQVLNTTKIGKYTVQYKAGADINEFRLDRTEIIGMNNSECLQFDKIKGCASKFASICLVYEGKGKINDVSVQSGDCLLIPAKIQKIDIVNVSDDNPLKLARCYAPLSD